VIQTGQLSAALASAELEDPFFWLFLLVTGVLGCLMAWISAMQINVTSPVTHHISSNSKAVAQTIIAVVWYHETKQTLWWISVMMVVCGALLYAVIRMSEEKNNKNHSHDDQDGNDSYSHRSQTSSQQSKSLFGPNSKPPEVETDATISDHSQP